MIRSIFLNEESHAEQESKLKNQEQSKSLKIQILRTSSAQWLPILDITLVTPDSQIELAH